MKYEESQISRNVDCSHFLISLVSVLKFLLHHSAETAFRKVIDEIKFAKHPSLRNMTVDAIVYFLLETLLFSFHDVASE